MDSRFYIKKIDGGYLAISTSKKYSFAMFGASKQEAAQSAEKAIQFAENYIINK